ncbi:MAG: response regulator transcription factor [Melioribacteraceae bacterium]|nr:response regulator transcription factor [Melioribacteraceae bacterium]MCF8264681.1 response regulator transcription factor [Melioribacteraceae bacterium]MCF8413458.1 response regulator transcription factor [Melioribacteraceae bacterium]MCF8431591.1 response regulator transcription factor [Melioribacteraceae bacterium]
MKKILLVEDDLNLGSLLSEFLSAKDYEVEHRINGEEGLKTFQKSNFDLLILDIMMPKKDGFTLAQEIRANNKSIPILFLSAKTMTEDRIKGLKIGADDYITKPFSMEELLLRISAILKRANNQIISSDDSIFKIGKYSFDSKRRLLSDKNSESKLTSKEAELLKLLCLRKNNILNRSEALTAIWNDDNYFTSRSMDVYIVKLRGYFKNDKRIEIINIHGEGFKLID